MTLWLIVGEAVERCGNNPFLRMVTSPERKRFMKLVSLRSQPICRFVRRQLPSVPGTDRDHAERSGQDA